MLKCVVISNINSFMINCNNCGHNSHCGTPLMRDEEDGYTGEAYQIEVCKHCRCDNCKVNIEDETKYDL